MQISSSQKIILLGLGLILFYILGMILPEVWWGTHYFAFLPDIWKWGVLFLGVIILLISQISGFTSKLNNLSKSLVFNRIESVLIVGITVLMACLFYYFPIAFDDYGDAFQYRAYLSDKLTELPEEIKNSIFSLEFLPSSGRRTVLFLYNYISFKTSSNFYQIFKWAGIIGGLIFTVSWLLFVRKYIISIRWRVVMSLIGLFAPFTQIYYSHIESYASVYTLFISWILIFVLYFRERKTRELLVLFFLLIPCTLIHPICYLLIFIWLLAFLTHPFEKKSIINKPLTWKASVLWVIAPLYILGIILYFFVLKDYADPRFLDGAKDIDRLFLPIFSPQAPLDRYNLFSWNHIFDFINITISWSAPALFILTIIIVKHAKSINWNSPDLICLGTLLILIASLLFMLNPLVSMPMDWDLYSFPAPVFLIFVTITLSKIEYQISLSRYFPILLILFLFSSTFFIVNANNASLSDRLVNVGTRVYKTYYLHANRIIINGLSLNPTARGYLEEKKLVLKKLKPFSSPGNDPVYANLLSDDGIHYLNVKKDYPMAIKKFTDAITYFPSDENKNLLTLAQRKVDPSNFKFNENLTLEEYEEKGLHLLRTLRNYEAARVYFENVVKLYPENPLFLLYAMEACFQSKDFIQAYYYATELVIFKYPDENKSYRIATHCALEAGLYKKAEEMSTICVQKFPYDKLMRTISERLKDKDNIESLRLLFVDR